MLSSLICFYLNRTYSKVTLMLFLVSRSPLWNMFQAQNWIQNKNRHSVEHFNYKLQNVQICIRANCINDHTFLFCFKNTGKKIDCRKIENLVWKNTAGNQIGKQIMFNSTTVAKKISNERKKWHSNLSQSTERAYNKRVNTFYCIQKSFMSSYFELIQQFAAGNCANIWHMFTISTIFSQLKVGFTPHSLIYHWRSLIVLDYNVIILIGNIHLQCFYISDRNNFETDTQRVDGNGCRYYSLHMNSSNFILPIKRT